MQITQWHLNQWQQTWEKIGMAPIILWVLVFERGYDPDTLDKILSCALGEDYHTRNVTSWIESMEGCGYEFPDGVPVFEVILDMLDDMCFTGKIN